ncbi:phage tail tape measure protein [Phytobacter diazotrophicus]|uniref:phage tail tape measure protein n=1 Tax=Phytobacter diazotrophicus TaxID=395631 RepID=UPI002936854B|nr:phage tail tape measure protein [Phytobacter diazotrophicus]MDV2901776.1 phage tail tape measure protein [Phytobacter diazotrophicus]
MATLRELIIKVSADSGSFQREIARASRLGQDYYKTMEQGGKQAAAVTRETQRSIAALNAELVSVKSTATGLAGAFAGAFATHQLIQYADTWNQLSGRLRLASTGAEDFTAAQRSLMDISQRTGTSFEANATLYSRIASSLRDAGYASADVAKVTETVATSLKLSGASTEEASSVITQLSQALGSGVLRGEEFNAIMENGGRLAKLLADGMKTTVGGLRNMAQNGELTTDKIVPLLTNVELLRKEFETLPASISGSAQKVQNSFMAWVGGANDAVGASASLAGVLDSVANNINTVANTAGILVGIGLARYFGNMVGNIGSATTAVIRNTAAEIALAQAQVRGSQVSVAISRETVYRAQKAVAAATSIEAQIAAERQLIAAQAGLNNALAGRSSALNNLNSTASLTSRLGSGVLSILGGWPGLIIGAGAAMYGLYEHTQQVHKEAVAFADNLDDINKKLNKMSPAGLRSTAVDASTSLAAQKKDLADLDEQIRKVKDSQSALAKIQQDYNQSPRLTYLNTFMDQADITAKNIELTGQLNRLEYQREQAASKVEATQKLVNTASDLATQKAVEQAGAVSILKGAYDLLNRSMTATAGATPPQYAGPVVSLAKATPAQQTALDKASRDVVLSGLDGLAKQHQQFVYEAQDLKLTGDLYTTYIYRKDEAAKKDAAAAQAKKDATAATNAQNKAEREAEAQAQRYASKIEDLSIAIQVQQVRASEGEKAADLYAAAHQSGIKWTAEQTEEIRKQAAELARWTSRADDNVKKQRDQAEALKQLTEAARKFRDEATAATDTAGLSDRERQRFEERQQIERTFDKAGGRNSTEAVKAYNAALNELDNKYRAIAASEADWRNGVSRGYENWLQNTMDIAGTVSQGVTTTMDSAMDNVASMLVRGKADWRSWGLSALEMIAKVSLQMAAVSALSGGSSSSFGGLLGTVVSGVSSYFGGSAASSGGSVNVAALQGYADKVQFFAQGGVQDSPSLSAYSNGVYNTPQMFAFAQGAGIFAEAGPEAIMPLTRASDGSLGVRAVSSGVNSTSGNATNIHVEAPVSIYQDSTGGRGNASDTSAISSQLQSIIQLTITDRLRKEITPGGILYRS